MLEHHLFDSTRTWRRRSRPTVLAVFSYRYDAELVPDLLANIAPVVDGWVAFDDRKAGDLFSSEPRRRQLLVQRAKDLSATWVLAMDPDERIELGAATRIRSLTSERRRIIWEFNLREMFTAETYRVDGLWGSKMQGRLFPVFDGPLCSDQPLHGAWCVARAGYSILSAGLNLYHLKMLSAKRRQARRDLYEYLDPIHGYQTAGYDYLVDETNAEFEQIPMGRDFFPAHQESEDSNLYMANVRPDANESRLAASELRSGTSCCLATAHGTRTASQLGQLRISVGEQVHRDSKLAVVVIGLRTPKSLHRAVRSLVQQDTPSEIVVVNSGGGDVSSVLGEYLRAVILVELREPVFVGAARNLGIQVSHAPFVAFLAGDCVAAPGWVSERTNAHTDGEGAVASVVENDKPRNPFAWAAHLVTYGHRMPGSGSAGGAYGASYDRALFDKYGYFSETRVIGEDSEFHGRFRQSDAIRLHTSVRTIHDNPGGLASFLEDQLHRGLRGRYLADFFGLEFSLGFIGLQTVTRVARVMRLSAARLQRKEQLSAVASWPFLPLGALFYFVGMTLSYVKANAAERLFRQATEIALVGQPNVAIKLLQRAIDLRPATARYHLALAKLLRNRGDYDESARQLYASWDIDRASIVDLYCASEPTGSLAPETGPRPCSIGLQLVVFPDSSNSRLAEFLAAVDIQRTTFSNLDVFVVEDSDSSPIGARLRKSYAHLVKFAPAHDVLNSLSSDHSHQGTPNRFFVVVSSCSCVPTPDWLDILKAYIVTYPEVELFHGGCRPHHRRGAGFIARLGLELELFPRAADNGGLLYFGYAPNLACDKSLLSRSGGLVDEKAQALGSLTLTERFMKAGGSSLYAPEWETRFSVESTLFGVLRRFYQDGYQAAKHMVVTKGLGPAANLFSEGGVRGSAETAWRFAIENLQTWRSAGRPLFQYAPVFLLLFLIGLSRQTGWLAGLKQFGDDPVGDNQIS